MYFPSRAGKVSTVSYLNKISILDIYVQCTSLFILHTTIICDSHDLLKCDIVTIQNLSSHYFTITTAMRCVLLFSEA